MTDVSVDAYIARMAIVEAVNLIAAPHTRMRPRIFLDGDKWCALYGENLMEGVSGFGGTPLEACMDFDRNFTSAWAGREI